MRQFFVFNVNCYANDIHAYITPIFISNLFYYVCPHHYPHGLHNIIDRLVHALGAGTDFRRSLLPGIALNFGFDLAGSERAFQTPGDDFPSYD